MAGGCKRAKGCQSACSAVKKDRALQGSMNVCGSLGMTATDKALGAISDPLLPVPVVMHATAAE